MDFLTFFLEATAIKGFFLTYCLLGSLTSDERIDSSLSFPLTLFSGAATLVRLRSLGGGQLLRTSALEAPRLRSGSGRTTPAGLTHSRVFCKQQRLEAPPAQGKRTADACAANSGATPPGRAPLRSLSSLHLRGHEQVRTPSAAKHGTATSADTQAKKS